jgi:serine phosphatase RsbU (regulator of sigma subunit)
MAYVVLDATTGALDHSIAGHPPPVLRLPDGSTILLETGRGPLLGIACTRVTESRSISPGTTLVMYTDGLIERRSESVDAGLQRLVAAVGDTPFPPDELCATLVARLLPNGDVADDVAIVAVELTA